MDKYVHLSDTFYSFDLLHEKANLPPHRECKCFFIVEHPCSDDFIQNQASTLLASQCKNFDFYGMYSKKWDIGFDLVDIQVHSNDDDIDVALTSTWELFEDFVEALELALSTRTCIPCDIYLFYDDRIIYNRVLSQLSSLKL